MPFSRYDDAQGMAVSLAPGHYCICPNFPGLLAPKHLARPQSHLSDGSEHHHPVFSSSTHFCGKVSPYTPLCWLRPESNLYQPRFQQRTASHRPESHKPLHDHLSLFTQQRKGGNPVSMYTSYRRDPARLGNISSDVPRGSVPIHLWPKLPP